MLSTLSGAARLAGRGQCGAIVLALSGRGLPTLGRELAPTLGVLRGAGRTSRPPPGAPRAVGISLRVLSSRPPPPGPGLPLPPRGPGGKRVSTRERRGRGREPGGGWRPRAPRLLPSPEPSAYAQGGLAAPRTAPHFLPDFLWTNFSWWGRSAGRAPGMPAPTERLFGPPALVACGEGADTFSSPNPQIPGTPSSTPGRSSELPPGSGGGEPGRGKVHFSASFRLAQGERKFFCCCWVVSIINKTMVFSRPLLCHL